MKTVKLVLLVTAAVALTPMPARADCFLFPVGVGPEKVCYTGVFPSSPILVEQGQPIPLPATQYQNLTNRQMTFTIEWAGVSVPGSAVIHTIPLAAGDETSFTDLALQTDGWDLGTRVIDIGWTAEGGDYQVTVSRRFEVSVVLPGKIREVIQLPARWCAVEGTPQAGDKKPGETTDGSRLLSLLREVNDQVWLPQAGILFRHALSLGIPVVKDPRTEGFELGDITLTGLFGGGEWTTAAYSCEQAWNELYPDQRGTIIVAARTVIGETEIVVGGVAPGVPHALWVKSAVSGTGQRGDALCGQPRSLLVGDVTPMLSTVVYDPARYRAPGSIYTLDTYKPVTVLAHELGHTLMLGHGNGLDDNNDGLVPPAAGIRRYDDYCDVLGEKEDVINTPFVCEDSSSLMRAHGCTNIRELQREQARAAAKLIPGAVLTDPTVDPAGALVAPPGPCPPTCTVPPSLTLLKIEFADTPVSDITNITHTVLELFPEAPNRYSVYADLDNDAGTGCSIAEPGVPGFQGAELRTQVVTGVTGGLPIGTPSVWQCVAGSWTLVSDPGIRATAYELIGAAHDADASGAGIISIQIPNAVRGPAGSHVRLQAVAEGDGKVDLLPANGAGGVISLIPPDLPRCSASPAVAKPGQAVSLTAGLLPPSAMVDIFVANAKAGTAQIAADGSLAANLVIPATTHAGVRPVDVVVQNSAVSAVCVVLVQGDAVTPATTAVLTPEPNISGWNNTPVNVALNAVGVPGGPGIKEISYSATGAQPIVPTTQAGASATFTISEEGQTVVQFFATNNSDVSEAPHGVTVSVDKTPPTITFSGNQTVYGVLDTVDIKCAATDGLSGILFDTCEDISGPAYLFATSGNTFSATAVDFANNVKVETTSFQIRVTYADLCTLTRQFLESAQQTPAQAKSLGNSMCAQLTNAEAAALRGSTGAARSMVAAYVQQVTAISPNILSAEQARILIALAGAL